MIGQPRNFCCPYDLSGLSQQASKLDREKMQTQLQSVTAILETAQRDLRILLLHLRPIELEQKKLGGGDSATPQRARRKKVS